ncbi:hypothetical protein [Haloferax elongans]|nr:hypothetical protein [Haloferax elongans]
MSDWGLQMSNSPYSPHKSRLWYLSVGIFIGVALGAWVVGVVVLLQF